MQSTLELSELDAKIGQCFMAGMPGPDLDDRTRHLINDMGLGGVILFARNIQDPLQVAQLCSELQKISLDAQGVPLFLAVDQEGGPVARLKEPFAVFPGNEVIGQGPDAEGQAHEFARVTAQEMRLVGLNMDLAPVLDVPRGEPEVHLQGRTFGSDPDLVSRLGAIVIKGLQDNGIIAVAKHFPGLGAAGRDPHKTDLTIPLTMEEMEAVDLLPFRDAIRVGVAGVMVSHAFYPNLDSELPGTLSPVVVEQLLRQEMGFDGLVLTDDLEMGAITPRWPVPRAAADAFEAGADLLLICENQNLVLESIFEIRKRLLQGAIPLERLHKSIDRIRDIKSKFLSGHKPHSIDEVKAYFTLKQSKA